MLTALGAVWARVRNSIYIVSGAYIGIGAAGFTYLIASGNYQWLVRYLRVPGALLLVALALCALWLTYRVCREFSRGEPLRTAWVFLAAAAALDLCGEIGSQLLGPDSMLNPLWNASWWSRDLGQTLQDVGLFLGGPCRFTLMAAGCLFALKVYRRAGFLGRLRLFDWIVVTSTAIYIGLEAAQLGGAIARGKRPALAEIAHYPTDPLLLLLLVEGLLLSRSVHNMGSGLVGWCWKAFSFGVFLVVLGDFSTLAFPYVPWPWNTIGWFFWFPGAAAFAAAPTYQLEAMAKARGSRIGA